MRLPAGSLNTSYSKDMAITRTGCQWFLLVGFLALLFVLPLFASSYVLAVLITIGITIISAQGINIVTGMCGQISIGQAGFMAVGAYTSAFLCGKVGLPFWLSLPCGCLCAGMVGVIFGAPSLRIKGFYLALATLAAQFIIIWAITRSPGLGAWGGIPAPSPRLWGVDFRSATNYYYIVASAAVLATFFAKNLARTRPGRAFVAIRDNDLAAEAIGISLWRYKLLAFFIASVYAGAAGALFAHRLTWITPEPFNLTESIWYLAIIVIGGMGSVFGAIAGSVFVCGLKELSVILGPVLGHVFPALATQAQAALAVIFFGLALVLCLVYLPRGLGHAWETVRNYYRLWPFAY